MEEDEDEGVEEEEDEEEDEEEEEEEGIELRTAWMFMMLSLEADVRDMREDDRRVADSRVDRTLS